MTTTQSSQTTQQAAANTNAGTGAAPTNTAKPSSGEAAPVPGTLLDTAEKQQTPDTTAEPPEANKPPGQKPVVPEKYSLTIDGKPFESEEFSAVAKELGMTQESAQKTLATLAPAIQAQVNEGLTKTRNDAVVRWKQETENDAEFGGHNLTGNLRLVHKALEGERGQVLAKLLKDTGFGNHKAVLAYLAEVGKSRMPDTKFVTGAPGGGPKPSPEARLGRFFENKK